jgi:hypothetical protein
LIERSKVYIYSQRPSAQPIQEALNPYTHTRGPQPI